jgi:hypothetical protein
MHMHRGASRVWVRVRARAKARAITGEEVMVKQRAFTMFSLRIRVEML